MATFTSEIDITNGGTYTLNISSGESYSKIRTDLNGKINQIQSYLQNNLPETSANLPTSLPHGKLIIYNNQLYFGNSSNVPTKTSDEFVTYNILDTICENVILNDANASYTFGKSTVPSDGYLYALIYNLYDGNNVRDIYSSGAVITKASGTGTACKAQWMTSDDTNSVYFDQNGITDTWRTPGYTAHISIYQVESIITDELLHHVVHIEGKDNIASSVGAHAEGISNVASCFSSHVEGQENQAIGNWTHAEGLGGIASGRAAHAEGRNTTASGDYSHAEGEDTTASGDHSHTEGNSTVASGNNSHAEGYMGAASGIASHVEGGRFTDDEANTASDYAAHAEGSSTKASGNSSHAEGAKTKAEGAYSHAEGYGTRAGNYTDTSSYASHAEGYNTTAFQFASHAEGNGALANGKYSHAEGWMTQTYSEGSHAEGEGVVVNKDYAHGSGTYNRYDGVDYTFIIGNGIAENARSNAFRVTSAGATYGKSSFNSSGADYAEYFEWEDKNPNGEDRVGYFVTLDNDKIKIANSTDYILGIISGQPCVIGNADEDWLGRWQHDNFNRFILEYLEDEEVEISTENMSEQEIIELCSAPDIKEKDNKFYRIITKVVDYETTSWRYKANPEYDNTQPYIERKDRNEWDAVGMMGVLPVWDDGTCKVNGFCQVSDNGTATIADKYISGQTYRVIKRVAENIVKVIFK